MTRDIFFRALLAFLVLSLSIGIFLSCEDEDSESDSDSPSDDVDAEDDDDAENDDDAEDDDDPCSDPVETPDGYFPYEASWLLATFDDPDLPITGLYAYFWIDWYKFTRCSYTAALSVIYLQDDSKEAYQTTGGMYSGLDIEFNDGYDIFVKPYMQVRLDPDDLTHYTIDLFGDDYQISLEIQVNHVKIWSGQWFSFYDATVTNASIQYQDQTYESTGRATLERWYSVGGLDPTKADFVQGYWLYDAFTWVDDDGNEMRSLLHYWYRKKDGEEQYEVVPTYGVFSRGDDEFIVVESDIDYDFSENEDTEGYLRRYGMSGQFGNGETFTYEAVVDAEYKDTFPEEWLQFIRGFERIESHSLISGELTIEGKSYTGRGLFEWKTSTYNPLVPDL